MIPVVTLLNYESKVVINVATSWSTLPIVSVIKSLIVLSSLIISSLINSSY